jgi:hypothetical protein
VCPQALKRSSASLPAHCTRGSVGAPPKDLVLVRLAFVVFSPKPRGWRQWMMRMDDVEVSLISVHEQTSGLKLLVSAAVELDYRPKVTSDGEV